METMPLDMSSYYYQVIFIIVARMAISILTTKAVKKLKFDDPIKAQICAFLNNNKRFLSPPCSHQNWQNQREGSTLQA